MTAKRTGAHNSRPKVLTSAHITSAQDRKDEALRRQVELTNTVLENSTAGLFMMDARGYTTYMNRAAEQMFGWALEEIRRKPLHEMIHHHHPDGRPYPMAECPIDRALPENFDIREHEDVFIRRNGEFFPVLVAVSPIFDSEGRPVSTVVEVRDISEGKRAEQKIRDSESTLRSFYASTPVLMGVVELPDDDSDILHIYDSRASEDFFGCPPGGTAGQSARKLGVSPETIRTWVKHYRESQRRGHPVRFEYVDRGRRGRIWLSCAVSCIGASTSGRVRFSYVAEDITERKAAEQALREETRALETLNRIGQALSARLDLEGVVQAVTDAATQVTGAAFGAFFYNKTNEAGEVYQLYTLSGAPREAFAKFPMPRNTSVFGPTFRGEGVVRLDDVTRDPRYGKNPPYRGMPEGHLPVRSYLAVPVMSRSREVIGGLFFGHHAPGVFTERAERLAVGIAAQAAIAIDNARLYEEKMALVERLREADRRKDVFLATLAHELRNPLAPIRNAVQFLQREGPPEPTLQMARNMIDRQVEHMVRLIDDLMEVSRITSGKLQLRRERVALSSVIERALETSRPHLGHELTISLPSEPIYLDADPVRLAQVFSNLLTNASKYTPKGGRIFLTAEREASEAVVKVRDTGIGIPPDQLPRLFDMFAQGTSDPSAIARSQDGLGVGLALSRSFVEMHGGRIEARSEGSGKGSEFVVRLPALADAEMPRGTEEPQVNKPSAPCRILVVDDLRDSAVSLASLLRLDGNVVDVAYNGEEALQKAETFEPDMILLDIGLPDMNGYDVCRAIRAQPSGRSKTIVAITGWGQDDDRRKSREVGFDAHVVKPVDYEKLKDLLAEQTRRA